MTDRSANPVFTAADDRLHSGALGTDWWATETAWFSFHQPDRRLGGWLYTMVRPNIGTVAGGCWVWDDTAHLPWEVPFSANYTALKLPEDQDLDDIALPTGVTMKTIEPAMSYDLGVDDFKGGERLQLALRFDGVMEPEPLTAAGSTFGSAHHFDQLGRVHGHIVLHGERIDIDCFGMRDRTWGIRPENRPRRAAYVTGATSSGDGFLAVTNVAPEGDLIAYGFLRLDGRVVSIAEGTRSVVRSAEHGWNERVTIEAVDADGRAMTAVGSVESRIIINRHSFIDINSLIRWDIDGTVCWGEDQDMWPTAHWSADRRHRSHT